MPGGNGTGPAGQGPGTGRGIGKAVAEAAMKETDRAQAPVEVVYALTVAKKCPTNRAHRAMESFVLSADHR